jgi:hypothetical protein
MPMNTLPVGTQLSPLVIPTTPLLTSAVTIFVARGLGASEHAQLATYFSTLVVTFVALFFIVRARTHLFIWAPTSRAQRWLVEAINFVLIFASLMLPWYTQR